MEEVSMPAVLSDHAEVIRSWHLNEPLRRDAEIVIAHEAGDVASSIAAGLKQHLALFIDRRARAAEHRRILKPHKRNRALNHRRQGMLEAACVRGFLGRQ